MPQSFEDEIEEPSEDEIEEDDAVEEDEEDPDDEVLEALALTSAERKHLKGLAHPLEPVIQVGHKGVTETLVRETDQALLAHELIKVKLGRHVPEAIDGVARALASGTGAAVVQTIGKVIVLYRPHPEPERQKIVLPRPRD